MNKGLKFLTVFVGVVVILTTGILSFSKATPKSSELTFNRLKKHGIVSGFGISKGNPLEFRNRIRRINEPRYVKIQDDLYKSSQLCVGVKTEGGWQFSPIDVLNSREIVNNNGTSALCYCPLAGLAIALEGDISISGLLKYDTFVLYDRETEEIILPFTQSVYGKDAFVPLKEVQLLNFVGVVKNFPDARILDPQAYGQRNPYGPYSTNDLQGIGHEKPELEKTFEEEKLGFHPKEMVLIVGFDGKLQKAYPFKELNKSVPATGGEFEDTLAGKPISIQFHPQYQWAYAEDVENRSLNLAYAYIFSMYQHLPDIPIYQKD